MVKKDLIANLCDATGLSTRECVQILKKFIETIKKSLADGCGPETIGFRSIQGAA
jgi:nucleoid DNA-binding protein